MRARCSSLPLSSGPPPAGRAPLDVLTGRNAPFDCRGDRRPRHESDCGIYELHVRGFTQSPSSGVAPERRDTYHGLVDLYMLINGSDREQIFEIQAHRPGGRQRVLDTGLANPDDFPEPSSTQPLAAASYRLGARVIAALSADIRMGDGPDHS